MNTPAEPIAVQILDREYQFTCTAEERKDLLDAAHHLNERMREIKANGRLMALERIAVMAALNLSDELLKMQKHEESRHLKVDSRIKMLADEIDNALDGGLG
jgi:cell division protein ZapA